MSDILLDKTANTQSSKNLIVLFLSWADIDRNWNRFFSFSVLPPEVTCRMIPHFYICGPLVKKVRFLKQPLFIELSPRISWRTFEGQRLNILLDRTANTQFFRFYQILKSQNVQRLQIFVILALFLYGNLKLAISLLPQLHVKIKGQRSPYLVWLWYVFYHQHTIPKCVIFHLNWLLKHAIWPWICHNSKNSLFLEFRPNWFDTTIIVSFPNANENIFHKQFCVCLIFLELF